MADKDYKAFIVEGEAREPQVIDNISKVCQGEVEIDDAMVNIIESTGKSAIVGYGTGFATGALQNVMTGSSRAFIQKVGNSCLPAAAVSFAVESYATLVDTAFFKSA